MFGRGASVRGKHRKTIRELPRQGVRFMSPGPPPAWWPSTGEALCPESRGRRYHRIEIYNIFFKTNHVILISCDSFCMKNGLCSDQKGDYIQSTWPKSGERSPATPETSRKGAFKG